MIRGDRYRSGFLLLTAVVSQLDRRHKVALLNRWSRKMWSDKYETIQRIGKKSKKRESLEHGKSVVQLAIMQKEASVKQMAHVVWRSTVRV